MKAVQQQMWSFILKRWKGNRGSLESKRYKYYWEGEKKLYTLKAIEAYLPYRKGNFTEISTV